MLNKSDKVILVMANLWMLILAFFALTFVADSANTSLMKEEMEKLEEELKFANLKDAAKKSLKDMTTDELVEELKKEIGFTKKSIEENFKINVDDFDSKKKSDSSEDAMWAYTLSLMDKEMADAIPKQEIDDKKCEDLVECEPLKKFCDKDEYKPTMIKRCRKSCNFCHEGAIFIEEAECADKLPNCNQMESRCLTDIRLPKFCPKTCGMCRAEAPPKCSQSQFGCCWDKETTKLDFEGKNCPECKNEYPNACVMFKEECTSVQAPGVFMRKYCPKICNFCSEDCKDDPKQVFYCRFWKNELKWCDTKKDIMQHYCPKTCNFC